METFTLNISRGGFTITAWRLNRISSKRHWSWGLTRSGSPPPSRSTVRRWTLFTSGSKRAVRLQWAICTEMPTNVLIRPNSWTAPSRSSVSGSTIDPSRGNCRNNPTWISPGLRCTTITTRLSRSDCSSWPTSSKQKLGPDVSRSNSRPASIRSRSPNGRWHKRAGLGFFGKNHMLINPQLGSQLLLGELITTLELQPDRPLQNQSCGDCGQCIRACPTGALSFDGSFDGRKCISYLTIESPDEIPTQYRDKLGNRIFGCDACIVSCPHELNRQHRSNIDFRLHAEWAGLTPPQIRDLTEEDFAKRFAGSGLIRTGLDKLKQTVACLHP